MQNINKKPPYSGMLLLRLILSRQENYGYYGDMQEMFNIVWNKKGYFRAYIWFWKQVIFSFPVIFYETIYWSLTMIRNYLKIAIRNMLRQKVYSLLNILGLSIGITCFILILLYVKFEMDYDSHPEDADRIYRTAVTFHHPDRSSSYASTAATIAPAIEEQFPEVEETVRFWPQREVLAKYEDKVFYQSELSVVDKEFLTFFSLPLITGDPETALETPRTLVITQSTAERYFGTGDPIGKLLNINGNEFEVSAVAFDPPQNSHLKFSILTSTEPFENSGNFQNWFVTIIYTYIRLHENTNVEEFQEKVKNVADLYVKETMDARNFSMELTLQPLRSIHLNSDLRNEAEPPGNASTIYLFSAMGLLILIIASINFMNLATARSANRANEVGLRKVVGAFRSQLIGQFLGESLTYSLIALILSFGFCYLLLPYFNSLSGIEFDSAMLFDPGTIISMIITAFAIGLLSGSYPALFLSSFRPTAVLKGILNQGTRGSVVRRILVIGQFTISIALIAGTIIIFQQLEFMKNKKLGFDKEQKLVIPVRGGISISRNYENIKNEFLKFPEVVSASASYSVPGARVANYAVELIGEENPMAQAMYYIYFDADFIKQYEIEIVAGRAYSKDLENEIMNGFLINEAASKAFGFNSTDEAIGKTLMTGQGSREAPIIGVTANFHYRGLQTEVEPLVMEYHPGLFRMISLSISTDNIKSTLEKLESKWADLFPGNPFDYYFLDEHFDRQYRSDEMTSRLYTVFTILGLFIAYLGLLGLVSFTTEKRRREIGIRKVLGANPQGISLLLMREFVQWILLSMVIAWPVAFILANKWLENFAYRINPGVTPFLAAGICACLIAVLTVSYQSIRAANMNPADSLRCE
ncbi:ABC transporter permease [candidate division KSB1 bacterium]